MKRCLLLLLLSLGLLWRHSRDQVIKGQVTDEVGKPLVGATVTPGANTILRYGPGTRLETE
jgi:hypothetical protein